jgi:pimeloyl-ACP methyl ester carboxylesterase
MTKSRFWIGFACAGIWIILSSHIGASDVWHVDADPGVLAQNIQFKNGEVHLSGTVYFPGGGGDQVPAVVALHDASIPTRESALYRHLREGLPGMGVAVLIYDRRGSGASSGTLQGVDYETLADDAIAGQNALAKLPRIDPKKIGFWGLSQGGWLAVLAAERSKSAAFAISVSAPLVTPEQQMEFATTNLLTIRGYSQESIDQMLETRKAWSGYLTGANSRDAAVEALRKVDMQPWFQFTFMPRASELATDQTRDSMRRKMNYDPVAPVRQLKIPLLFIYGGSDPWVPVERSVQQLRLLMHGKGNIHYAVVSNASHEMMFIERDPMAFGEKAMKESAPQAPEYFIVMASWLCRQIGK